MANREFALLDYSLKYVCMCYIYSSVGVLYDQREEREQDHRGTQAAMDIYWHFK